MFLGEVFINQNAEKFVFYCFLLSFLGGPLLNINIILKVILHETIRNDDF